MKISEILEKMDNFTDAERVKYIGGLWEKVSYISKQTLRDFEICWDCNKTFEEFKKAQNKIIKECIQLELMTNVAKTGTPLEIFTMETEV